MAEALYALIGQLIVKAQACVGAENITPLGQLHNLQN
jgi:hypothetical protein